MKKILCGLLMLALMLACLPLAAFAADNNNMSFAESKVTIFENDTYQLLLKRSGVTQEGDVTYTSSARCVSVDENGMITAKGMGGSTITASVKVNNRNYTCTCYVTVNRAVTEIVVKEDNLNVTTWDDPKLAGLLMVPADPEDPEDPVLALQELPVLMVNVGRDVEFSAWCNPRDASNRRYTMETSDEKVAKVVSGNLRPVNAGECLLTFYSNSNPEVSKTYRLLVVKPVTGVTVESASKVVFVGETLQLNAVVTPADATIADVVWTSENEKQATVDAYGCVTGLQRGQATIRATAADGSKRYGRITLNVQQKPEYITLDKDELNLTIGTGKTIRATVMPNNASDKNVVWTSSDDRIAKVNQNGYVTPVARGMCVITCSSKAAPEVYAEAYINVIQPVTSIKFSDSTVTVDVGSAAYLDWTVNPANASDPSVTLSTSDSKIAAVDQNGYVYGVKRGECYVYAKANDGSGKTGRITVKVTQPVLGVHMKNDTVTVGVHESSTLNAVMEPTDASNNRMTWYSSDTRIATVSGKNNKPTVTGQAWGTTTVYGTTEDGGYTTSCTVKVGNYDKALKITDLYLLNNAVKMVIRNESNMNITYFNFAVELYDFLGNPIPCNPNGSNIINGSYGYTLYEGESTQHGRFNFGEFYQPETQIAKLVMRITGYRTDDGYRRSIADNKQPSFTYESPVYVGPAKPDDGEGEGEIQWITPVPQITEKPVQPEKESSGILPVNPPAANIPVLNVQLDKNNGKHPYAAVIPVSLEVEEDNRVRVVLQNNYQKTMHTVHFEVELYDKDDNPIICNTKDNNNIIDGQNAHELAPGAKTKRGTFEYNHFQQPATKVSYALVRMTSYVLKTAEKIYIPEEYQPMMEYRADDYTGEGHLPEFLKKAK